MIGGTGLLGCFRCSGGRGQGLEPGELDDPTLLQALTASGIRVSIDEGERNKQDLRIK